MKKVILSFCAVALFAFTASAQFHIELGLNGNLPQGDFADAYDLGIGFYAEPKYALNENIDLGLLIGRSGFAGADLDGGSVDATGLLAITPSGTYRFSGSSVTPYAGLALGFYIFDAVDITVTDPNTGTSFTSSGESSTEFGFAPRAGVYIGRLNLGAAYNIVKDANFIQFNLGVRILSRD